MRKKMLDINKKIDTFAKIFEEGIQLAINKVCLKGGGLLLIS